MMQVPKNNIDSKEAGSIGEIIIALLDGDIPTVV